MTLQTVQIKVPDDFIDLGRGDPGLDLLPLDLLHDAARDRLSQKDPSILQYGFEQFCIDAAGAGVDGLILPDLPQYEFEIVGGDITNQSPIAKNTNAAKSIKNILFLLNGISICCLYFTIRYRCLLLYLSIFERPF